MGGGGLPVGGLINLLSIFGWKGILVGLVLALALGGGGMCMGGEGLSCLGGGSPSTQSSSSDKPVSSTPQEDELVHFVSYVFDDVQKTWTNQLQGYQPSRMVLFRRGVQTACGTASTAVGPFYCPNDQKVYIDLSFYDELRKRFGAPGDFAQAYVIAHEVGHHVQNLSDKLGGGSRRANDQVPIELQADCLAGAWAKDADKRGLIEVGDIDEALNAASQIGDDTLQRKTQGNVQPETWTHGSAAQRSASFKKGYEGGPASCGL
jgi:predicted metalloprotease